MAFDLRLKNSRSTPGGDLDADTNYYSHVQSKYYSHLSCNYYTEHKLSDVLPTKAEMPNNNCLSIHHLNIRSLTWNFDNLLNSLAIIKHQFSFIGVLETWLHQDEHYACLDWFNFVHNYRPNIIGRGVGFYLANEFKFHLRHDVAFDNTACAESMFVEIHKPNAHVNFSILCTPICFSC